ncbi:prolyl 3-hydroxylase OGFOD1 [Harpegnathos saltator]|uniref:prolyl 3-hydroxylase OGFOD1 n=1 Tax=Harpegnathos saltator TaxID=610380 RepID=UPI000948B10D|nr:prolyl 3-hydroxylase OGFOD1 [Harpegnathos saltator]
MEFPGEATTNNRYYIRRSMADTDTESQTMKHSLLSEHVISNDFQKIFSEHWHSFRDFKSTDIEVISKPFRICRISNFLRNKEFLEKVKDELLNMEFKRKVIDLYQFEQSADLNTVETEYVRKLRDGFRDDVTMWMELNTDITLNGKISMSCSIYFDTDHLLCHDDNLEDRRIAFILYVMDEWTVEDGGALDLFDTDENGFPGNVAS